MGVAMAPTAAGMSSSTAAMRMSLRIRTMARASFFIHFLPKNIFSPFLRRFREKRLFSFFRYTLL